jgi:hypothetical protein
VLAKPAGKVQGQGWLSAIQWDIRRIAHKLTTRTCNVGIPVSDSDKLARLLASCLPDFLCPGPKMSEHMANSGHCEMQEQRLGGLGHVPNNTSTMQACGLVPTSARLPDLRGPHLTVLMWCRTLLLRPGMVLLGPGSMIRLLSLGGRWSSWLARCMRHSVVVGMASEASVLEVWVVSARMGSCGGGVCERTCCRQDNTSV